MAGVWVLVVSLLALWPARHSRGAIVELTKLHHKPLHYVDLTFDHALPSHAAADPSEQPVWKRQTAGGQPHIDGEHEFHDTYRHARIHYTGENSHVIVILTYDLRNDVSYRSNLYRSTDYGSTFTNINKMVLNATLFQGFYTNGDTLVYVAANPPRVFYSNNQGADFTTVTLSPTSLDPTTVDYHPTKDGWMMMQDDTLALYVTENYGKDWKKVAENVDIHQWSDEDWDTDDTRIYFTTQDPDNANDSLNLFFSDHPYSVTPTEFDPNLGDHDGFLIVGRYIFAQRTEEDDQTALYVSDKRRPFQKAMIPIPEGHRNYLVSHINDVQALVIVEHEGDYYNLYLSDETGVYFSLSLADLVIESRPTYQIDLELIEGLNGTLIANQYAREDVTVTQDPSSIRTVITLDNGGFWEGLLPPDRDIDGNAVDCGPPECSLHLHMDTTNYARLGVYSTDSAPGIIVAHGNTGTELSNDPDLYISRNGGINWEETLAGSWGVNVADHGGLMVAAKDYHQESSTSLMYSCDEGSHWQGFEFSNIQMTVFGVITEPGQHTTVVSLYGGPWGTGVPFEWIVVTVDFAGIFSRDCNNDDYYDWKPWDERTGTPCILGSTITIERREAKKCCLNGRDYDREFGYKICPCTIEDYECDYGYFRPTFIDFNAPCVRDPEVTLFDPCADGKTEMYTASTGYRKIAGDVCKGGEESLLEPFISRCCGNTTLPPTFPTFPSTYHPPTHQSEPVKADPDDSGVPMAAVVVLGVLLGLVGVAAVLLLVFCLFFSVKYKTMRQKYVRVVTAGEPDLLTYTASPHEDRDTSDQNFTPVTVEDDDKPLIP